MAKAKRKSRAGRSTRSTPRRAAGSRTDAIGLLKSDHREVESLFAQFQKTRSQDRKLELARRVCAALKVHTAIEEEIFYPAFYEATGEKSIHHEAEVEHEGAKKLIAEIEASGPQDDYFDAKVKVLSEMIRHHVNEEEKRDGMFAKAKQSEMDLAALGEQLAARKSELMEGESAGTGGRGRGTRAMGRQRAGAVGRLADAMRY